MKKITQKQIIKNNKKLIKSLITALLDFHMLALREIDKKEIRENQVMNKIQRLLNNNIHNLINSLSLFDKK